jgi:hypothetical protein
LCFIFLHEKFQFWFFSIIFFFFLVSPCLSFFLTGTLSTKPTERTEQQGSSLSFPPWCPLPFPRPPPRSAVHAPCSTPPYYIFILVIMVYMSYFSHTCWVPTISVLKLTIFSCYLNILLKSWRRIKVLRWGVLNKWLPPVDCLWCYDIFPLQCFWECSA